MGRWLVLCLLFAGCDTALGLNHFDVDVDPYAASVLADRPVAYFPLDETSGLAVHDRTGGGAGTILGNVVVGQEPPFPGARHAMRFDGDKGAIDLGDRFQFVAQAPYSIEVWALLDTLVDGAFYNLASKWRVRTPTIAASGWNFFYSLDPAAGSPSTTKVGFSRETEAGGLSSVANGHATEHEWHHLVGTFDGIALTIYVDGVLGERNPSPNALDLLAVHLLLGAGGSPTATVLLGSLGQVAIYDYALDPARISAHYHARSP